MAPFWTQGCLSPGELTSAVLEQHVSQLNLIKTFMTLFLLSLWLTYYHQLASTFWVITILRLGPQLKQQVY